MKRRLVLFLAVGLVVGVAACSDVTGPRIPKSDLDKEQPQNPDANADVVLIQHLAL